LPALLRKNRQSEAVFEPRLVSPQVGAHSFVLKKSPARRAGLHACAFVLEEINEAVERMVTADRTEH
jgi:hypothetical protein